MNPQVLAELTKAGITQHDLQATVSSWSWANLHEAHKRLREGSESILSAAAEADGIPSDVLAAHAFIGAHTSRISDEIDASVAARAGRALDR